MDEVPSYSSLVLTLAGKFTKCVIAPDLKEGIKPEEVAMVCAQAMIDEK